MNKRMDMAWNDLKAAWRAPDAGLDEAAILAAVRREAAVRPARRGAVRRRPWIGAAAVAASLAWAAFTLAQARGTADRQIGLAWMNSIEPQALQSSVMVASGERLAGMIWSGD